MEDCFRSRLGGISILHMEKAEIEKRLLEPGIITIIRTNDPSPLVDAAEALLAGGVRALEITMNTPGALQTLKAIRERVGTEMALGVGTVLDETGCREALESGVDFVVTPISRPEVIALCNQWKRPIISGAFTPTEAWLAHEAGADFIKLFPATALGPVYMKELRAPMPQLRLIPTGGVSIENIGAYLQAGCAAVAVGSALLDGALLARRDMGEITLRAERLVAAAHAAHRA